LFRQIRGLVGIEIRDRHVPHRPLGLAVARAFAEAALAVIQVDEFRVGRIVAEHSVQRTVAIHIDEARRVRAVRLIAEIVARGEVPVPVPEKYAAGQWPVPTVGDHDVGVPVAIHIPDAHIARSQCTFVEHDDALVRWEARASFGAVHDQGCKQEQVIAVGQRGASGGS
jgi:hypothetical protein